MIKSNKQEQKNIGLTFVESVADTLVCPNVTVESKK